jgi:signal transduction histidine kinase
MTVQREHSQRKKSLEEQIRELQQRVDELTEANHDLKEQLERKEQFTAMIAHELRGPLSPIINYAQMLAHHLSNSGNRGGEEAHNRIIERNTNIIISQARRLNRLVNDLLDSSRLSSGQFTLFCEPCDIVALIHEMVEQLRPVAPYHRLLVEAPEGAIVGNWDAGRLQQAIGNLLDNAIKYSDERTTVTIRLWTTPDTLHVSVHNEGLLISSSDISLLFKPYTRLPASSSRKGSGLGLYITKSIIEAHGGSLHLDPLPSAETGDMSPRGTTFTFELPLSCKN